MKKIIESEPAFFISFTEEELAELNINKDDVFDVSLDYNGLVLKKREKIELELSEYPREILEYLIKESLDKNKLVSDIINDAVDGFVKNAPYCDPEDD